MHKAHCLLSITLQRLCGHFYEGKKIVREKPFGMWDMNSFINTVYVEL